MNSSHDERPLGREEELSECEDEVRLPVPMAGKQVPDDLSHSDSPEDRKGRWTGLLTHFALELLIYGALLTVYFFVVLRLLGTPLAQLFHENLWVYAPICLGLIVVQGVFLEVVTSFLVQRLGVGPLR